MAPPTPENPRTTGFMEKLEDQVPIIDEHESFSDVVRKLNIYVNRAIDTPFTYEQLRTTVAGHSLKPLLLSLSDDCHHPAIVAALLCVPVPLLTCHRVLTELQSSAMGPDNSSL